MSLTTNEIPIASPCGVEWSTMTRREATKRFCGECKKHVHDLSMMSELEARALIASPTTEGLCVRYLADERGHIAFRPDVPTARLRKTGLAVAAIALPLSLTACMGAMQPPVLPPTSASSPAALVPEPVPTATSTASATAALATSATPPPATPLPAAPPSDKPAKPVLVVPTQK